MRANETNKTTKGYIVYKAALCFVVGLIVIIFDLKITSSMLIEEIHQVQDNVLVEAVVTHSVKTYEGKDSDGFIEREYDLTVEYKYNQTVYESIIHTHHLSTMLEINLKSILIRTIHRKIEE